MFSAKVVDKVETNILCSITFFPPENRAVYEIMRKNIVERARPQMTVWRMHIECLISKAKNSHWKCVILIVFPLQQWLHEAPQCYVIRTLPDLFHALDVIFTNALLLLYGRLSIRIC
jgi:hypothetical protein